MRIPLFILLLCSFTLISGNGKVNFRMLSSGMNSNVSEQKQDIIHSKKAFIALWNQLHKTESMMGDLPPEVDFSKKSVVACYMGDQSNGMKIDSVRNNGTVLTIYERKEELEPNCYHSALLVTSFQLIEVDGSKWTSATAEVTVENVNCED